MNFIQKITQIFALASDDKGLYVFFLRTSSGRRNIEQNCSNIFSIAFYTA